MQAKAGSITILEEANDGATDAPGLDELPDTGGVVLVVFGMGALLGGILLAERRWFFGYSVDRNA